MTAAARPRFSGHESFACRYAWLPKAVAWLQSDPEALSDDDDAMGALGLGKNMVRSLRFWLEVFDVAESQDRRWRLTDFGAAVFGADGLDPFLERAETQWLLHWKVTTQADRPLFAWRHVFYRRHRPDFTRAELLYELQRESRLAGFEHSDVTLRQHIDVFLHSYVSTARDGAPEDTLDGPLIDLALIRPAGRRTSEEGRLEHVYTLATRGRPPASVVEYAILEFRRTRRSGEAVVTLHDLAYTEGAPGPTFRLIEDDLRDHVRRSSHYSFRVSGGAGALHFPEGDASAADLQLVFGEP